ncbi:TetR/AcrR family transcriptional regulator [Arthrobacter sp. YAF34]|uniref:TetR/AcrR family transcriptional regulator n=1 Tax=Arthrobacter sp. YAF34 TaxID=3233083 RepID=UPI003F9071E0
MEASAGSGSAAEGGGPVGGARERILDSARALFAEYGVDAVDYGQIARAAAVNESLVSEQFPRMEDLFNACVELPVVPEDELAQVIATAPDGRGEALVRTLLKVWDSPAQSAMLGLVGKALGSGADLSLMREVFLRRILGPVVADLETDPVTARLRGALVASQLMGLVIVRYLVKLDPLATASPDDITRFLAPTIQHYFTGDLHAIPGSGDRSGPGDA